ncbi:DUF1071 domain-containing protein [Haemophilus influenzae]|uniref:Sak single strand annealing protein n=1 Tax=Haemophilus influenzae TaxID=727 RepID=UPI000DD3E7BD|nr:DUF1071 domain-containing protein [Haemophilus influenzae]
MKEKTESLQRRAWDLLSTINVNDKTETKGTGKYALTYLSWSWAWGVLMEHYPESVYEIHQDRILPDGSVMVSVTLTIKDGDEQFSRFMWLPVMNHLNKAIINPDAMDINKAIMRCLAKTIAMCGLGHYIYVGEDLPVGEETPKTKSQEPSQKSTQQNVNSTQDKSILDKLKDGLKECGNKKELEERYAKQMPWIETHHPDLIDEYNSLYDVCINNLKA